ncbi:hypothetical protein H0H92_012229 [Tricholoma furcatifolium]|nr:hypothetical protein H0H92_012229 [Tricholoma furcatifolium]
MIPTTIPLHAGEGKHKPVRGCTVVPYFAVLSIAIVKQSENAIPGVTNNVLPKHPKRARKDRESTKKEDAKPYTKAPKIQRLVTPFRLQRRRVDHQKEQKGEFDALAKRTAEKKLPTRPP